MGLMEDMVPAVSVAISLASPISEDSGSLVDFNRIKLLTGSASLLSDPVPLFQRSCDELMSDLNMESFLGSGKTGFSGTIQEAGSNGVFNDDLMSIGNRPSELLAVEAGSISLPVAVAIKGIDKGQIVAEVISSAIGRTLKASVVVHAEKNHNKSLRSVFELEYMPLWGSHSVCGKRPEMEDAVSTVPQFMKVPVKMFAGDHMTDGMSPKLKDLTAHFFGVYDGHGGCQVADYCRDRVHIALEEELKVMKQELAKGRVDGTPQVQWQKAFGSCFQKVDDEAGGKACRSINGGNDILCEPVALETVGSTAVVALISSSHIVVANCGDSRAVLYRGKEAMALSNDHKPNREDEYERIEAAGGRVIQWNGHRVFGILAMSRSIGDRYLKPWIIPEPEVTFTPRARDDECLILASDGLWDVMSNEEVCKVAQKRILLWHKKNGEMPVERGIGAVDPAAQAAADYLSMLALQKGSKDNVSVIVVDLKTQRKFKSKP